MNRRCEAKGHLVTINVWHAWGSHTGPTFRHWWALNQIWVCCGANKATRNRPSIVFAYCHTIVCAVSTCSNCTPSLYGTCEVCFISDLESFGKLTNGLVVVPVSGRIQCLTTQDLWLALWYLSQRHRPPDLNFWKQCLAMLSLTVLSPTWSGHRQIQHKLIKQTTPKEMLQHRHISSSMLGLWRIYLHNSPALVKRNWLYVSFSSVWIKSTVLKNLECAGR